jgi:ADP-heptose:LPS heptosyltransferase
VKREHILVIRFSALGDVAMTVPVVWAVAQQYPQVRITVLSRPSSRQFFEDLAPNVNFMAADIKGEYRGVKGLNSLYRRLVAKQFTAVADLHNVLRSEYLRLRFNMGRFRVEHINKHRHQRRQLVAPQPKKRFEPLPTSFQNYLDVFARLGYPVDMQKNVFHSIFDGQPLGKGNLNYLPKAIGPKRSWEQWIGIAPFAAHKGKIYPIERMQQVVKTLIEQHPKCRILLFGRGEEEDRQFSQWITEFKQCTYVSKNVENMYQELILMSHLDVMLSMDSANMHMASLTATPVVSVWGATHPMAGFMGWQQNTDNAIQVELDCRPCSIYGNKPCRRGDYACLNQIQPETIIEKINQVLSNISSTEQIIS